MFKFKWCFFFSVLLASSSSSKVMASADEYFCFKTMTYNIQYTGFESPSPTWEQRKSLAYDVVTSVSPDLIALQEDGTPQRDDILTNFPEYGFVGTTLDGFSHRAILFKNDKFTLLDSDEFFVQSSVDRKGTWAKLKEKKTGITIFVINGHFIAGSAHTNLFERRLDAAVAFATEIAIKNVENSPVVMMGDLNGISTSQYVQYLISDKDTFPDMEYPDNFRKLYTPTEWTFDVNYPTSITTTNFTIDYILTSDDLSFAGATKTQRRGVVDSVEYSASDHSAVSERICHGSVAHLLPPVLDYILRDEEVPSSDID